MTWEQLIGSWGQAIFFLIELGVITVVALAIMALWKTFKGGTSVTWKEVRAGASQVLVSLGIALFVGAIFHQTVYGTFSIGTLITGDLGFMRFMMYSLMLIFFGLWISATKRYRSLYWLTGILIFTGSVSYTLWLRLPADQREEQQQASQNVLEAGSDYVLAKKEWASFRLERSAADQRSMNRVPVVYRTRAESPVLRVASAEVINTTVAQCYDSGRRWKASTKLFGKPEKQGVYNGLPTIAVVEVGAPTSEWVYALRHNLIESDLPPTPIPVIETVSVGATAYAVTVPVVQSTPIGTLGIQDAEPEPIDDDGTYDMVVATVSEWTESAIVPRDGDAIEFGPFDKKEDVERLMVRRTGRPPVHLEAKPTEDGQWKGRVRINQHDLPNARQEVRLERGDDLMVVIEVVERRRVQ